MKQTTRTFAALLAAVFVQSGLAAPMAVAQTPEPDKDIEGSGGVPKWSEGVSQADQDRATELFQQGTSFLLDFNYNDAIDAFREALKLWDHPTIHYNLAVALANVAEPLEVYKEFVEALKYDGEGLEPDYYKDAVAKRDTLIKQLVQATVECNQPDARVIVDGKDVGTCKDKPQQLMRAGEHSFTALKDGYETTAVSKVYRGGDVVNVELKMIRPEDLTRYRRKFPTWVPWVVTGAGVAFAGAAGLLHASARDDFKQFDSEIIECGGCQPTQEQIDLKDGAGTKQNIAIVGYVIGASALIGGIALLVINRPQPYRVGAEEQPPPRAAVVPLVSKEGVGVAAAFRF